MLSNWDAADVKDKLLNSCFCWRLDLKMPKCSTCLMLSNWGFADMNDMPPNSYFIGDLIWTCRSVPCFLCWGTQTSRIWWVIADLIWKCRRIPSFCCRLTETLRIWRIKSHFIDNLTLKINFYLQKINFNVSLSREQSWIFLLGWKQEKTATHFKFIQQFSGNTRFFMLILIKQHRLNCSCADGIYIFQKHIDCSDKSITL